MSVVLDSLYMHFQADGQRRTTQGEER